jgi:hypothetical protein
LSRGFSPDCPALALVTFTTGEIKILNLVVKGRPNESANESTLSGYLMKVARLGGYLARTHDPPPGNKIAWRGWSRLADIRYGAEIATATYG